MLLLYCPIRCYVVRAETSRLGCKQPGPLETHSCENFPDRIGKKDGKAIVGEGGVSRCSVVNGAEYRVQGLGWRRRGGGGVVPAFGNASGF